MQKTYHLCMDTLSNELRLKILELLKQRPMGVSDIAAALKAERSRVSHALAMLKVCSIVKAEKRGKEMIYHLNPNAWPLQTDSPQSIFTLLDRHISVHCHGCPKMALGGSA